MICSIRHMVQVHIKGEAIELETKLNVDADFEAEVDETMAEVINSRSLILKVVCPGTSNSVGIDHDRP